MTTHEPERARRGTWTLLASTFDEAVARLPDALKAEGFGVITQIDLREVFQAKLGVAFRRYRIFGACSPAFALKAVEADPKVGLLLPCNIVIFEQDDASVMLGVIDPLQQLGTDDPALDATAKTIADKLARVTATLCG
jgi:uncharacterized protein (DUF302 family)